MTLRKIRTTKGNISEPVVIDFGTRKISRQNFSRIVALPKMALQNRGKEITEVNVKLVQFKGERLIQLTPIGNKELKVVE